MFKYVIKHPKTGNYLVKINNGIWTENINNALLFPDMDQAIDHCQFNDNLIIKVEVYIFEEQYVQSKL